MFIIIFALITSALGDYCYNSLFRLTSCSSRPSSFGCVNYYQFSYDANAAYTSPPQLCANGPPGTACVATSTTCTPPCYINPIKAGGPNGKVCSDFTLKADCVKWYADNNGDRWCYWSNNACHDGLVCWS